MGVGGDGAVKKAKLKGKHSKKKAGKAKGAKKGKKQKGKKQTKNARSTSRDKSSSRPSTGSSAATSKEFDSNMKAGRPSQEENGPSYQPEVEADAAIMVKPEKIDETCLTTWSEPTAKCCVDSINRAIATSRPCGDAKCRNVCLRLVKQEVEKDMTDKEAQVKLCLERMSNERDYYRAEFERLLKFFEKLGSPNIDEDGNEQDCLSCQKKQQMIEYLQRENQVLMKEKFCLMSRLEEGGTVIDTHSPPGRCNKPACKRLERERDLLKIDIQRLEEEQDCLRDKIKTVSENKTRDYAKFQEQRIEYENIITRLESERRELIKNQGTRRITINSLEEKLDMYTNLLRAAQEEVHRLKTQYCQLKKLHEQCDKALLDTQSQLAEVEIELSTCQKKKDPVKSRRYGKETQASPLKCPCTNEVTDTENSAAFASPDVIKKIAQLDKDKDELLPATEANLAEVK